MVKQNVTLRDVFKKLINRLSIRVEAREVRRVLQLRIIQIIQSHVARKGHRPLDAVNLEGLQLHLLNDEFREVRGHTVFGFEANHTAPLTAGHGVTNSLKQVVRLVLFNLHVRITGDAEHTLAHHLVPREEKRKEFTDDFFCRHHIDAAVSERIIRLHFIPLARHEEEAGNVMRHAETRVVMRAVTALQFDQEIDRDIRDSRERMSRVDRLRRENRINLRLEPREKRSLSIRRKLIIRSDPNTCLSKSGLQFLSPVSSRYINKSKRLFADFRQLTGGRHLIGAGRTGTRLVLLKDIRHTDHEKFIKIRIENREELHLIEQRAVRLNRRFENALIEVEPGKLAVRIESRRSERSHLALSTLRAG